MVDLSSALSWTPRGAWAGIAEPGSFGAAGLPGITVDLLDGLGLATLIAGPSSELSRQLESVLGGPLPAAGRTTSGPGLVALWSAPNQWLLRAASREAFAKRLAGLSEYAAVSDQSDARAVLRLSGARVRDLLAKGVMLDLHPETFAEGDAASTIIAYVGVQLWRLPDGPEGPVFELLVPRSMAGSFWSWLAASAAEFGCKVTTGRG